MRKYNSHPFVIPSDFQYTVTLYIPVLIDTHWFVSILQQYIPIYKYFFKKLVIPVDSTNSKIDRLIGRSATGGTFCVLEIAWYDTKDEFCDETSFTPF